MSKKDRAGKQPRLVSAHWAHERRLAKEAGRAIDRKKVEARVDVLRQMACPMRDGPVRRVDAQVEYVKHVERTYGLKWAEYLRIFQAQDARCAVCLTGLALFGTDPPSVVDHCHRTGKVRGILCHGCNVRVGRFEPDLDNPLNAAAIDYIRRV